jgi:hypothetical protein
MGAAVAVLQPTRLVLTATRRDDDLPALPAHTHSYKKVRRQPEYAGRSIISMVQQQQPGSSNGGSSSSSSSSVGGPHSRELAVAAELDTFMLDKVLAGAGVGPPPAAASAAGAAVAGNGSGSSSRAGAHAAAVLRRDAIDALPWLKGLLWTMTMYFAGVACGKSRVVEG